MSVRLVRCPPAVEGDQENGSDQMIRDFSLPGLFAEGQTLTLNAELGTLSVLVIERERPRLLVEQQFPTTQLYLLLPLLASYPYYCPHEVLLASFSTGRPLTEEIIKGYRHRLHEASMVPGLWDQEMKPVRNALSRLRWKLRYFALNVHPILETGYVLIREPRLTVMEPEHASQRPFVTLSTVGSEGTHEEHRAAPTEGAASAAYRSQVRPASLAARGC